MRLPDLLDDVVGLTLVHWDAARGLTCWWSGGSVFLEYTLLANGRVKHGECWSLATRPASRDVALDAARAHYNEIRM